MYKSEIMWPSRGVQAHEATAPQPVERRARERASGGRVRDFLRAAIREPLSHFLLFGVLIFAVAHVMEARSTRYRITVSPDDIVRIVNSYTQQYGSEPQPSQIHVMIDNYIREEVFLREGMALHLDKDDEIVRRRIAQKYSFLQADMAVPRQPTESELHRWFNAHRDQFALPAQRSFEHRYFAIDQRGEAAAKALAEQSEKALAAGRAAPAGDEFPGPKVVARLTSDDVERLFGGADFAKEVFAAPTGKWAGPFRSGYGWHVLRVTEAVPTQVRSFEQAHADALTAWQDADRAARNDAAYRKLLSHYQISRADRS